MLLYTAIMQQAVPIKLTNPQINYNTLGPNESKITLNMIKAIIVGILIIRYDVDIMSSPNII